MVITTTGNTRSMFTQISHSNLETVIIIINSKLMFDIRKSINVNNAHGPGNISGRMIEFVGKLLLCH